LEENHRELTPAADDGLEEARPILSDVPHKEVKGGQIVSTRQRNTGKNEKKSKATGPSAQRRVVVLIALVGVLTVTSALLLAIAPAPLSTENTASLLAVDTAQSFDELFESPTVPVAKWGYIYIHHSASQAGNATTLAGNDSMMADHFVIGNGDGCADGEIQIGRRWKLQLAPGRTPGADSIVDNCISICMVGDFNQARPTPTQQRQLVQLTNALQAKLHIPASRVFFATQTESAAGIGSFFPASDFRKQIAN